MVSSLFCYQRCLSLGIPSDNVLHSLPVQDLVFKGLVLQLSLLHPTFTHWKVFPTLPGLWQLLVLHPGGNTLQRGAEQPHGSEGAGRAQLLWKSSSLWR